MRKIIIGMFLVLSSFTTMAANQGVDQHTLLSCTLDNGKDLVVGFYNGGVRYSYGDTTKPELVIDQEYYPDSIEKQVVDKDTWSAAINFKRGQYVYKAMDSNTGAGVLVLKNGNYVASFNCDPDTTYSELNAVNP